MQIVKLCFEQRVPITPRGRGTGTTGGATAPQGGVMLSFERMDSILDLNLVDRSLRAQPGVTNQAIQQHCESHGLFWAPDPGSAAYCTLGGNLACNAAGPHALKYGTTRGNTLQIKAVSGTGKTLVCGAVTSKSVVGLDLLRLLIGSEGILAIITEAVVKLNVLTEARVSLQANYASVEAAVAAVCKIMRQHPTPCALELIDDTCVELLRKNSDQKIAQQTQAILMIEFDGSYSEVEDAVQSVRKVIQAIELLSLEVSSSDAEAAHLWEARKALSPTLRNHKPHKINEDVVVPLSQLAGFVNDVRRISQKYQLCIASFGHIGNGNLHVNVLYDSDESQKAQSAVQEMFESVVNRQGSISGEHGVGLSKLEYAKLEIDRSTLEIMQELKRVFDPAGILNSGKALP